MGWQTIVPTDGEMERLVTPAIARVKAGRLAEAYEPLATGVRALASRGAQAVVLGCTEIPLGIQAGPWQELPAPLIDTIDALALAAIRWARG
jgi:aspartate racemase